MCCQDINWFYKPDSARTLWRCQVECSTGCSVLCWEFSEIKGKIWDIWESESALPSLQKKISLKYCKSNREQLHEQLQTNDVNNLMVRVKVVLSCSQQLTLETAMNMRGYICVDICTQNWGIGWNLCSPEIFVLKSYVWWQNFKCTERLCASVCTTSQGMFLAQASCKFLQHPASYRHNQHVPGCMPSSYHSPAVQPR